MAAAAVSQRATKKKGVQWLERREPGPEAIKKGIDSLLAGLRVRHPGYTFVVEQWPDGYRAEES